MRASRGVRSRTLLLKVRWLFFTVCVFLVAVGLVLLAAVIPPAKAKPVFGKPVSVPAGQVSLTCPQVPPTVNPDAVDTNNRPLAAPQIAGSTSAAVLARTGKIPQHAMFQPVAVTDEKQPETGVKGDVLRLMPRSGALFGKYPEPISGFLTADPWEGKVVLAAAHTEQSVSSGDYRGLATAACQAPAVENWLVGGSTAPGNSAVLQLLNPSENRVKVRVEVWADTEKVKFPRGEEIMVAPRSAQKLPLESQVSGYERLVIRVTAGGGGVAAYLMTHDMLGLNPGGVSLVTPAQPPAQTQVIPGVIMDKARGAVRLMNPENKMAHVNIEVVNENGRFALPGGKNIEVDPDSVLDVGVGALQEGSYAVVVRADSPVVAGAVMYRQVDAADSEKEPGARDLAWVPSRPTGGGVIMGAEAIDRQLLVTNLTTRPKQFSIDGAKHPVAAGRSTVLTLKNNVPQLVVAPDLYVTQVMSANLGDGAGIDVLEPAADLGEVRRIYVHFAG